MASVGPAGVVDVELLRDEAGGLLYESGIATVSFYDGDGTAAAAAVREQAARVVAANPWLAGRLVRTRGTVALRHPEAPSAADVDALLEGAPAAGLRLDPSTPYAQLCAALYKAKDVIVASGSSLVGKDEPVARIAIVAGGRENEFALVFSLCHAVGDGRTYYEVLRMLAPGADVRSFAAARYAAFPDAMRARCNKEALAWVDSPTAMWHMLPLLLGCGSKARCSAFFLDEERVKAAKAAATADKGDAAYVSTNDVLTSGFFMACKTRVGLMGSGPRGNSRGGAAAGTRIFCGDESRRRCGGDADISRRRVAAAAWLRRGDSAETSRGGRARDADILRRRVAAAVRRRRGSSVEAGSGWIKAGLEQASRRRRRTQASTAAAGSTTSKATSPATT